MAELIFKRDFPEVLQPEFERYFKKFNCILPKWVNSIHLHYCPQPDDCDALLEVVTRTEYRLVEIIVYSDYMSIDNEIGKSKAFLHEFSHIFTGALHRTAIGLADLLPDELSRTLAYESVRFSNESAVEDLCTVLYDLIEKVNLRADISIKDTEEIDFSAFLDTSKAKKVILNTAINATKPLNTRKAQLPAKVASKPRKKKG